MTLVLGVQCTDGVVIAADRKVLRGGEPDYENKIRLVGEAAIGFAGLTGLRDDFLLLVKREVEASHPSSLFELKVIVEDVILELAKRYGGRVGPGEEVVEGIIGGLESLTSGPAQLYHVVGGYAERVGLVFFGHGGQYAQGVGRFLLRGGPMDVDQTARLASFVISWVSEDLDATVGGFPHVVSFRDNRPGHEVLDLKTIKGLARKADALKRTGKLRALFSV